MNGDINLDQQYIRHNNLFREFYPNNTKRFTQWFRRKYIKTVHWEYWPMWLVYLPAFFYYCLLAVKARSFFFFSASNPSIETGGMFFESKWDIFSLIPKQYYPATILVTGQEPIDGILNKMQSAGLKFPVVAKPDRGERGWCVEIICNEKELAGYLKVHPIQLLLQEYVSYPVELSVFYARNPEEAKGKVTSLTRKELLSVYGDGMSTLYELILKKDRAFLQLAQLSANPKLNLSVIPSAGEKVLLVPYGNHARGALFLDECHLIDEKLVAVFDHISSQIPGFFFGRFDIRCAGIEDLKNGIHFSILELNGAGAEPAHIYQPGFSLLKAQAELFRHYSRMYRIARANQKQGAAYMDLRAFLAQRKLEKAYKQKVTEICV